LKDELYKLTEEPLHLEYEEEKHLGPLEELVEDSIMSD